MDRNVMHCWLAQIHTGSALQLCSDTGNLSKTWKYENKDVP